MVLGSDVAFGSASHDVARVVDPYANKYIISAAVTLAAVLQLIDTSIVNVAIPHMMGTLGATLDEIAWVSTSYIIANVIVIPLTTWLSSFFGRQRYLTGSILVFVGASFFCGASASLWELVFWRVIQGFGGGALLATAQATLFESFPPEERGIGQAIFGVGLMVGPTVGPTLGGFIVDAYSWPWIFYINIPLGLVAAFMTWTYVKDVSHEVRAKSVDVLGIVLLTLAVGSLQWMLERGERYDWFESRLVTSLAITSVLATVLLVWRELTVDEPVIDFRVLASRQLAPGVIFGTFLGLALFGSIFVLPVFLQMLHGFTAEQTGWVILPGALASAVSTALMGRIGTRLDARIFVSLGVALFVISMWQLGQLPLDAGKQDFFWPLIIRGAGLGFIFVPLTTASVLGVPVQKLGPATGMFNLMRQLGGSLGIAIMATLLSRFTNTSKSLLTEHVGIYDPNTVERLNGITHGLMSRGTDAFTAHRQALSIIDLQISAQASVMAFSRIYIISGLLLLLGLPLLLIWRTGRTDAAASAVMSDAH